MIGIIKCDAGSAVLRYPVTFECNFSGHRALTLVPPHDIMVAHFGLGPRYTLDRRHMDAPMDVLDGTTYTGYLLSS